MAVKIKLDPASPLERAALNANVKQHSESVSFEDEVVSLLNEIKEQQARIEAKLDRFLAK